jgi:tripartite-type tricarboxylate transporter receptor subunit TctC
VFVTSNQLPARTIPELVELARRDPGKLNYGSTGLGSGSHLATELFMVRTGIRMTHVPFRGAAPLVQELMAGRIDVSNSTLASVLGQINSGDIRAIGLASPQRTPSLPNVPTLREQGVSDADAESWTAFFAPAGVPKPIVDRLSGEIIAILNTPGVRNRLAKLGFTVAVKTPDEFRVYHQNEMQTWAGVIRTVGLKAEMVN